MIERLKRWWRNQEIGRQENVTAEEDVSMAEELHKITAEDVPELKQTQDLLRESRAKSREASKRLDDYQERIRREYAKRVEIARESDRRG